MRGTLGVVVVIALSACARQDSVQCDDGRTCPAATVCSTERGGLCLSTAQTTACAQLADGTVCDANGTPGICDNHLCLPGCGDGHLDDNEECDDNNFASHDGCSSACKVEIPAWTLQPQLWSGTNLHTTAYDADLKQLVVVGGQDTSGVNARIWQRDATKLGDASAGWHEVTAAFGTALPTPRSGGAMAYDASRHVVVLFGGNDPSGTEQNDTWEYGAPYTMFEGVKVGVWRHISTATVPPPRFWTTMAYDDAISKVVLFGGAAFQGGLHGLADTWTYDGTWTDATSATPPSANARSVLAFDKTRQKLVLFGSDGKTYEFTGTDWSQVSLSTAPQRRFFAGFAYDISRAKLILFGGRAQSTGTDLSDTWSYDGTWQPLTSPANPSNREAATLTPDPDAVPPELVLVGGSTPNGDLLRDVWELTTSWTARTPRFEPPVQTSGTGLYRSKNHSLYVWGGFNRTVSGQAVNELWHFDGARWTQGQPAPQSRTDHAMGYDPVQDRIVVFGGNCTDDCVPTATIGQSDNTYVLDPTGNSGAGTWTTITGSYPQSLARADAALVYDEDAHLFVLFGGGNDAMPALDDTWTFSGASWSQIIPGGTPNVPAPTEQPAAGWDPVGHAIVAFDSAGATWKYKSGAWTQAIAAPQQPTSALPRGRHAAGFSYDVQRKRFLLTGGIDTQSGEHFTDTWELDPAAMTWTEVFVPGTSPLPRHHSVFAPVSNAREHVLYGGTAGAQQPLGDVWTLQYRSVTPDEVCGDGMDNDGDSQIDAADPDCAAL